LYLPFYASTLKSLTLKNCQVRDTNVSLANKILIQSKDLQTLNLSENKLTDVGFEDLMKTIREKKTVVNLNMRHNHVHNYFEKAYQKHYEGILGKITNLDLSCNLVCS
jgi:hypothetical protein